ncbi:unnamed protein product [Allacma fusca]|uniref:Uncharacterized protein n=1 Tax=Allacma fusca TaxID=39272 RepID=A0A8J2KAN5_9HEXA|nr:unnamed protein product [Allacma fusca]
MKNIRSVIFVAIVLMAAISAAQPDPQDAGYLSKEEFDCQMQKAVEERNKQLLETLMSRDIKVGIHLEMNSVRQTVSEFPPLPGFFVIPR